MKDFPRLPDYWIGLRSKKRARILHIFVEALPSGVVLPSSRSAALRVVLLRSFSGARQLSFEEHPLPLLLYCIFYFVSSMSLPLYCISYFGTPVM